MKAWGSRWEEKREKAFFFFLLSPMWLLFFYFCYFYWGDPAGASVAQTAQTKHTKVLWLAVLWWIVLFTATESVELFTHSYTNATQKYLNSSLFQIDEMCLNKLIIIKIFCRHNNLMPVETRSAFASTSFFLFLSVFLHFLSEQHVFISTCRS